MIQTDFHKGDMIAINGYGGFFEIVDIPEHDNLLRVKRGDDEFWINNFQVESIYVED